MLRRTILFAAMLSLGTLTTFAQKKTTTAKTETAERTGLAIGSSLPVGLPPMQSTKGVPVRLEEAKTAKGLLVMFSCNTCPYVVKSQERTKEIMKYAQDKGIGMVIVNSNQAQRTEDDSYEHMVQYAATQEYTAPYVVDQGSVLANTFGATRTPEVYLFDSRGSLVYKGAMEDNPSSPADSKEMYLKNAIDNVLAGNKVTPATTKSIGCSIKRVQS